MGRVWVVSENLCRTLSCFWVFLGVALLLGVSGLRNKREKEEVDIFYVRIHLKLCPT